MSTDCLKLHAGAQCWRDHYPCIFLLWQVQFSLQRMQHAELINLCQATAIGINREMVNFELGKEIERCFSSCLCGSVVKHRSSEVRFLMGSQIFFFVPRSWQDEHHLYLAIRMFLTPYATPERWPSPKDIQKYASTRTTIWNKRYMLYNWSTLKFQLWKLFTVANLHYQLILL